MKSRQLLGVVMFLVCAFLWGSTFVAQCETGVGPFTYLAMRSVIAVVFLGLIIGVTDIRRKLVSPEKKSTKSTKILLIGGVICGCALFLASSLQQIGIDKGTTAGKAGFITAMYLLIVPILGLFMGKKVRGLHWVCVVLAIAGLFMLCLTENITEFSFKALFSMQTLGELSLQSCDIYVIACAFVYAVHILAIDKVIPSVDGLKLSFMQFSVTAVLAAVAMFIFESPSVGEILDSWVSILYAGILSSGVAYTLQILAQKFTPAAVASILMSLESTFAVLSAIAFSAITTGVPELPTGYEWIGIVLMFLAIVISQVPEKKKAK